METLRKMSMVICLFFVSSLITAQEQVINTGESKYNVQGSVPSYTGTNKQENSYKNHPKKRVHQCVVDSVNHEVIVSEKDVNGVVTKKRYKLIEK